MRGVNGQDGFWPALQPQHVVLAHRLDPMVVWGWGDTAGCPNTAQITPNPLLLPSHGFERCPRGAAHLAGTCRMQ